MANVVQLDVWNQALLLVGDRPLSSDTEDREARYRCQEIWKTAPEFCVEQAKPTFARKGVTLTLTASATVAFGHTTALPADHAGLVGVYRNGDLSTPYSRYVVEGSNLLSDQTALFIRYVSNANATNLALWDTTFAELVIAYMAMKLAERFDPDKLDSLSKSFTGRLGAAIGYYKSQEPVVTPSSTVAAVDDADHTALLEDFSLLLGVDKDDPVVRSKFSQALNVGLIESTLAEINWQWGTILAHSVGIVDTTYGFTYVHALPAGLHNIVEIYTSDVLDKLLADQHTRTGDQIYTNYEQLWIRYVPESVITDLSTWPSYFKRLVAARMAVNAGAGLAKQGAQLDVAAQQMQIRTMEALSADIPTTAHQTIAPGRWVGSRAGWGNGRRFYTQ